MTMNLQRITTPAGLDEFIKNPYGVLFFTKGDESGLIQASLSGVPKEQLKTTRFAALCGAELFAYMEGRLPTEIERGVTFIRKGVVIHQLDENYMIYFLQCVNDLHNTATLPLDVAIEDIYLSWSAPLTKANNSEAILPLDFGPEKTEPPLADADQQQPASAPLLPQPQPQQKERDLTTSTTSTATYDEYKCCIIL
ncbi:hypothetical protein IWQ56_000136 [Coemansia nantahalensis]|uniref:Uncharacterized protein n=2 Tax=Coemansia TaxID=4863 RepID=A0ACC1L2L5_9FUNG|nr:hypothetical protein IWQ57_003646 [Coemansia nantahalensis]KAJ2775289.1 hypothetical protein IWQ56_000136 [Coemansia nantahalensis]KAJ2800226.1 hypothetical protein H4R21_003261 [Coemansia helicoidea]